MRPTLVNRKSRRLKYIVTAARHRTPRIVLKAVSAVNVTCISTLRFPNVFCFVDRWRLPSTSVYTAPVEAKTPRHFHYLSLKKNLIECGKVDFQPSIFAAPVLPIFED